MGELSPDTLDIDSRPLWEQDPVLWNKLSPAMKKQFTPKGQTPPKPRLSPEAEKEKAFVYQQHYEPTREELEAMTPAEYARWRSLQPEQPTLASSRVNPVDLSTPEEKPAEPDIPTLEAMSDEEYRAWYLKREASK